MSDRQPHDEYADHEDDYYDEYDDEEEEPEHRSRKGLVIGLLVLAAVIVVVGFVLLLNWYNDSVQRGAESSSASRSSRPLYGSDLSHVPLTSASPATTTTPTTTPTTTSSLPATTTSAPTTTTAVTTTTQPPPSPTTQAPVPTPPPPPPPPPAAPAGDPRRLIVCDITASGQTVSIYTETGDSYNWQVPGTINRYGVYDTMVTTDPNGPRNVTAATQVTTVDARSCPVY